MSVLPLHRLRALACACLLATTMCAAAQGLRDGNVPGEILLKLATTDALPALLANHPITLQRSLGSRPIYRVKVVPPARVNDVIAALKLEPAVQIAQTNPYHQAPEARKNVAWAIGTEVEYRAQWAPQAIHLAEAQAVSTGAAVRVAVLDTGADFTHPALAGRLLPGWDFVDGDPDASETGSTANKAFGHGTHVAGLIALAAPDARIMPLRVLDADGMGDVWALAEALVYAVDPDGDPRTDDGAHVINMSLGTLTKTQLFDTLSQIVSCEDARRGKTFDLSDPGYDADKQRCKANPGAIVVVAAGNDASTTAKEYPAAESANGLLSVAASAENRQLASFSNSGGWIESAAPGDAVTSSVPGGYGTWSGTSMAAPLAAGTAALVRAMDLAARPKDVVPKIIKLTSNLCGTKLRQIDALAAVTGVVPADQPCP